MSEARMGQGPSRETDQRLTLLRPPLPSETSWSAMRVSFRASFCEGLSEIMPDGEGRRVSVRYLSC